MFLKIVLNIFLLILILKFKFIQSISSITPSTTTSTTTIIKTLSCKASMSPKILHHQSPTSINGLLSINDSINIYCSANLTEDLNENFMHPVFDLSFGDTTNTGLFIVRGKANCYNNHTICNSEFKISTLALFKLLLSSPSSSSYELNKKDTIKVTCDIADTSRHSRFPIRCSDSTTFRMPKVLNYGDQCLINNDECGTNMKCINNNNLKYSICQCKQGYINITKWFNELNQMKTICSLPKYHQQQCNFDEQCMFNDINTNCKYNQTYGYPICQCKNNYILSINYICQLNETITKQQQQQALLTSTIFKTNETNHINNNETKIKTSSSINKSENKLNHLGLVIFLIVLLWLIIIVAILIRYKKQKKQLNINNYRQKQKIDNDDDEKIKSSRKNNNNVNHNNNNGNNGKIINKSNINHLNDNVEMRIDDDDDDDQITTTIPATTTTTNNLSEQKLNEPPNFDIFAKQSVV